MCSREKKEEEEGCSLQAIALARAMNSPNALNVSEAGYLATLTTTSEYAFLRQLFREAGTGADSEAWVNGFQNRKADTLIGNLSIGTSSWRFFDGAEAWCPWYDDQQVPFCITLRV